VQDQEEGLHRTTTAYAVRRLRRFASTERASEQRSKTPPDHTSSAPTPKPQDSIDFPPDGNKRPASRRGRSRDRRAETVHRKIIKWASERGDKAATRISFFFFAPHHTGIPCPTAPLLPPRLAPPSPPHLYCSLSLSLSLPHARGEGKRKPGRLSLSGNSLPSACPAAAAAAAPAVLLRLPPTRFVLLPVIWYGAFRSSRAERNPNISVLQENRAGPWSPLARAARIRGAEAAGASLLGVAVAPDVRRGSRPLNRAGGEGGGWFGAA
jgi:hypothetical protein